MAKGSSTGSPPPAKPAAAKPAFNRAATGKNVTSNFNKAAKNNSPKAAFNKAAAKPVAKQPNKPAPALKPPGAKGGPGTGPSGPSAPTAKQQWASNTAKKASKGQGVKLGQKNTLGPKFNRATGLKP